MQESFDCSIFRTFKIRTVSPELRIKESSRSHRRRKTDQNISKQDVFERSERPAGPSQDDHVLWGLAEQQKTTVAKIRKRIRRPTSTHNTPQHPRKFNHVINIQNMSIMLQCSSTILTELLVHSTRSQTTSVHQSQSSTLDPVLQGIPVHKSWLPSHPHQEACHRRLHNHLQPFKSEGFQTSFHQLNLPSNDSAKSSRKCILSIKALSKDVCLSDV